MIITVTNPFDVARNRKVENIEHSFPIAEYVDSHKTELDGPFICLVDGKPLMREFWATTDVGPCQTVVFYMLPEGGGSNPLKIIAGVILMVAAFFVTGLALAIGLFVVGAGLAVSGLLGGMNNPSVDQIAKPSSVFNLSAQSNLARIGEPIPVLYGKHKIYPNFGAQPYTRFIDNKQFLFLTFIISQGFVEISNINIDDTPLSSFDEVDSQFLLPGETGIESENRLFGDNVRVVSEVVGQLLARGEGDDNTIRHTSTVRGGYENSIVLHQTRTYSDNPWIGPFTVNEIGNNTDFFEIDISYPRGLYDVNGSNGRPQYWQNYVLVEWQLISPDGVEQPAQSQLFKSSTVRENGGYTAMPVRDTFRIELATRGQYKVRVKNAGYQGEGNYHSGSGNRHVPPFSFPASVDQDGKTYYLNRDNQFTQSEAHWQSAKISSDEKVAYGNVSILRVKIKATDNINGDLARKINVIAERKLPTYDENGVKSAELVKTRSPMWAVCDMLTNIYGAGVSDLKQIIDFENITQLASTLERRGDHFDGVFDREQSLWEALKLVLRTGRSVGVLQTGRFRVIRDKQKNLPVAMFSPRNMIDGSFAIKYNLVTDDQIDGVALTYVNSTTWRDETISVKYITEDNEGNKLPAVTEIEVLARGDFLRRPIKLNFFGCTNPEQALREAKYMARNNLFRRKTVTFSTEMEGYIPTFGDLVMVSHDMPDWGIAGDLVGIGADGELLLGDLDIEFKPNTDYRIAFRSSQGEVIGPFPITIIDGKIMFIDEGGLISITNNPEKFEATITRGDKLDANHILYYGTEKEKTHWVLGETEQVNMVGLVKAIKPRGEYKVDVEVLIEDNRVHRD